jgi:flagellar biosynthesis/type III secretory pathway protein FliH
MAGGKKPESLSKHRIHFESIGFDKGYKEGKKEGKASSFNKGFNKGVKGFDKGFNKGVEELGRQASVAKRSCLL